VEFAFGKFFGSGLGDEDELAEVTESGRAARGDAIGSEGFEDALEGTANIEGGFGAKEALVQFGGEILVDGGAAAVECGMGTAEAFETGDGGSGALTSIGEGEVAEAGIEGLVLRRHPGSVAQHIPHN
jgi:hypothetical protein